MSLGENKAKINRAEIIVRTALFFVLIYFFLIAVKMFGDSAQLFTQQYQETWDSLVSNLRNPFVGLCLGIFVTALMQSSSATTSLAVAMVATGTIEFSNAVTIVMGANIGTSLTCMLVALGHMGQKKTFAKAFSAALIQDNFNLLTVGICFTLEITCGYLTKLSTWIVSRFSFLFETVAANAESTSSSWFVNPIPIAVEAPVSLLKHFLMKTCGMFPTSAAILMGIAALFLLFFALIQITKNMQILMADKIEVWLNQILSKNGYLGLLVGLAVTMIVQSSSITTSLMVPLVAAGILNVRTIFPIVLGANIGTTITAILASLAYTGTAVGMSGLQLALVHFLFNVTGVLLFYPVPFLRFPVFMTEYLTKILTQSRWYVFSWIALIFFLIPGIGLWLFR